MDKEKSDFPKGRALTPHDEEFLKNRQQIYDQIRLSAPKFKDDEYGRTLLTKFRDVESILKCPSFSVRAQFSEKDSYMRNLAATGLDSNKRQTAYEPPLVLLDDPDHRRVRQLITKFFTPKAVEKMRDPIIKIASDLLDKVDGKKIMDLITDYAAPLSTLVILKMLGLPEDSVSNMRKWSEDILMGYDPERTSDARKKIRTGYLEMSNTFKENIQSMVVKEKPSLMSAMLEAKEEKGLLSDLEIISLCTQLMVAGNVTTSDLIGNGFYALLNSPGSLELLNQNPELLENAVEEMLRFDCPISETGRIAQEDTLLDNHRIKSHETVTASLSAANHDPEKFSNPHEFRLDRSKNDHIAFGTGIHLCLGAALARLESQLAFKELLTKYPRICLSHQKPPIRRTLPFFSGFTSLTVQLSE